MGVSVISTQRYEEIVTKYNLRGDGQFYRYELLSRLASAAPNGIFLEVGFRAGTGVMAMIEGTTGNQNNLYCGIDPFGNLPYGVGKQTIFSDYTNERRAKTLRDFYTYIHDQPNLVNFQFFNLESSEFSKRYTDGIPDYFSGEKRIRTDYSLVHLDGQHTTDAVLSEVMFFSPRIQSGGFIVIDDTEEHKWMDMDVIEAELFSNGFVKHEWSVRDKWAYQKQHV